MNVDFYRQCCISLPHVTEQMQWGDNLVFKIGGKIFAIVSLDAGKYIASFKCGPEDFADLTERDGIAPAPYLARAQWIALERRHPLSAREVQRLLRTAYDLIFAKLTKKQQAQLSRKLK